MNCIAIGSGKRFYGPNWTHIDGDLSFPHVKHADIWLGDEKDNSVDLIYACHFLNYMQKDGAIRLLKRWYEKLKVGGILRLAVPDFYVMSELYQEGKVKLEDISGPLMGNWLMDGKQISHTSVWDYHSLGYVLFEVGFDSVSRYRWQETEISYIDDHSQSYLLPKGDKINGTLISLNVSAVK